MDGGPVSLKWNNHSSTFFHVLETLRRKELYSDVTIACDGKFFSVHKLVLSTCSEYFQEMFERTQCKHPIIVLKDINHKDLESLLNYMYIGEVNVIQTELSSLIKAAECLKVKGLAVPDEPPPRKSNKRPSDRDRDEGSQIKRNRRIGSSSSSMHNQVQSSSLVEGSMPSETLPIAPSPRRTQESEMVDSAEKERRLGLRLEDKSPSHNFKDLETTIKVEKEDTPNDQYILDGLLPVTKFEHGTSPVDSTIESELDDTNETSYTSHLQPPTSEDSMGHLIPSTSRYGVEVAEDSVHDAISRHEPLSIVSSHLDEDVSSDCDDFAGPDSDLIEQKSEEEDQPTDKGPEAIYVRQSQHKVNKRDYGKVQYCIFCSKGFTNLSKHFFYSHSKEQIIIKIEKLPVNSVERKYELESIRNLGNYQHNCEVLNVRKGEIIPYKCPQAAEHYSKYLPCQHCLGFFKKKDLWKHDKVCHQRKRMPCEAKYKRLVQMSAMLLPSKVSNSALSENVLSKMKVDDISLIAKNDPLIIAFGERLYQVCDHLPHLHTYVSQKMRELCRLLKSSHEADRDVFALSDLINPSKIPTLIKAVQDLCKFKQPLDKYGVPSLALKICHSLKKCALIEKSFALQKNLDEQREKCDKFIEVLAIDLEHKISSCALTT